MMYMVRCVNLMKVSVQRCEGVNRVIAVRRGMGCGVVGRARGQPLGV
jgi:hypothetical protein